MSDANERLAAIAASLHADRSHWLPMLLERYERSSSFGAAGPWRRDVIVKFDRRTFPEAFDSDSANGGMLRIALRDEAELLASVGAIRVSWSHHAPGELHEVRVGADELRVLSTIARAAGYLLLEDTLGKAKHELDRRIRIESNDGSPAWARDYVGGAAALSGRDLLRWLQCGPLRFKEVWRDEVEALAAVLRIAQGVAMPERVASERILGHSKRLAALRHLIVRHLITADPRWFADGPRFRQADVPQQDLLDSGSEDVLAAYGIWRRPPNITLAGDLHLEAGSGRYCLADYPSAAVLPSEWAESIGSAVAKAGIRQVTTIENETPFHLYVAEAGGPSGLGRRSELVVYTAGFAGMGILQMLTNAISESPLDIRHWGDPDVGGFRIWAHLRRELRITCPSASVSWWRCDAEWIRTTRAQGVTLSPPEALSLRRLRDRIVADLAGSDVEGALAAMDAALDRSRKFEQESWGA